MIKSFSLFALLGVATLAPQAQAAGNIDCKLSFNLEGWSVFYKTASGTGTITCDNGAVIPVKISSKGGGLTVGKSKITAAAAPSPVHTASMICWAPMRPPRRMPAWSSPVPHRSSPKATSRWPWPGRVKVWTWASM